MNSLQPNETMQRVSKVLPSEGTPITHYGQFVRAEYLLAVAYGWQVDFVSIDNGEWEVRDTRKLPSRVVDTAKVNIGELDALCCILSDGTRLAIVNNYAEIAQDSSEIVQHAVHMATVSRVVAIYDGHSSTTVYDVSAVGFGKRDDCNVINMPVGVLSIAIASLEEGYNVLCVLYPYGPTERYVRFYRLRSDTQSNEAYAYVRVDDNSIKLVANGSWLAVFGKSKCHSIRVPLHIHRPMVTLTVAAYSGPALYIVPAESVHGLKCDDWIELCDNEITTKIAEDVGPQKVIHTTALIPMDEHQVPRKILEWRAATDNKDKAAPMMRVTNTVSCLNPHGCAFNAGIALDSGRFIASFGSWIVVLSPTDHGSIETMIIGKYKPLAGLCHISGHFFHAVSGTDIAILELKLPNEASSGANVIGQSAYRGSITSMTIPHLDLQADRLWVAGGGSQTGGFVDDVQWVYTPEIVAELDIDDVQDMVAVNDILVVSTGSSTNRTCLFNSFTLAQIDRLNPFTLDSRTISAFYIDKNYFQVTPSEVRFHDRRYSLSNISQAEVWEKLIVCTYDHCMIAVVSYDSGVERIMNFNYEISTFGVMKYGWVVVGFWERDELNIADITDMEQHQDQQLCGKDMKRHKSSDSDAMFENITVEYNHAPPRSIVLDPNSNRVLIGTVDGTLAIYNNKMTRLVQEKVYHIGSRPIVIIKDRDYRHAESLRFAVISDTTFQFVSSDDKQIYYECRIGANFQPSKVVYNERGQLVLVNGQGKLQVAEVSKTTNVVSERVIQFKHQVIGLLTIQLPVEPHDASSVAVALYQHDQGGGLSLWLQGDNVVISNVELTDMIPMSFIFCGNCVIVGGESTNGGGVLEVYKLVSDDNKSMVLELCSREDLSNPILCMAVDRHNRDNSSQGSFVIGEGPNARHCKIESDCNVQIGSPSVSTGAACVAIDIYDDIYLFSDIMYKTVVMRRLNETYELANYSKHWVIDSCIVNNDMLVSDDQGGLSLLRWDPDRRAKNLRLIERTQYNEKITSILSVSNRDLEVGSRALAPVGTHRVYLASASGALWHAEYTPPIKILFEEELEEIEEDEEDDMEVESLVRLPRHVRHLLPLHEQREVIPESESESDSEVDVFTYI